MISLNYVMGIIRRCKNSIIGLRLRFLEIPHLNIWVSWGVLFEGLGVQKGTQAPMYSDFIHKPKTMCPSIHNEVKISKWFVWNWHFQKYITNNWGVLMLDFWGFMCPNDTQTPCWAWLRHCFTVSHNPKTKCKKSKTCKRKYYRSNAAF